MVVKKKTYYTSDIKNPYCSKQNFLWKHNDDKTLGKRYMVYNEDQEIHVRGKKQVQDVKKLMKRQGAKHVGYTEWSEDD